MTARKILCLTLLFVSITAISAPGGRWVVEWMPTVGQGLNSFEGTDTSNCTKSATDGVRADGNYWRVDITTPKTRLKGCGKKTDRQRNEVKGMRTRDGHLIEFMPGEQWRLEYKMLVPNELQATKSFTHIHQLFGVRGRSSVPGPLLTLTLRRRNGGEYLQTNLKGKLWAEIPMDGLRDQWLNVTYEYDLRSPSSLHWIVASGDNELINIITPWNVWREGMQSIRPKWGIYRSLNENGLHDGYLLFSSFKASKLEFDAKQ